MPYAIKANVRGKAETLTREIRLLEEEEMEKSCCNSCAEGGACEGDDDREKARFDWEEGGQDHLNWRNTENVPNEEESEYLVDTAAEPRNDGGYYPGHQALARDLDPRNRIGGDMADFRAVDAAVDDFFEDIPEAPNQSQGNTPSPLPSYIEMLDGRDKGFFGTEDVLPSEMEDAIARLYPEREKADCGNPAMRSKWGEVSPAQVVQAKPVIAEPVNFKDGYFKYD